MYERATTAVARMLGGPCDGFLRRVELDDRGRPPLDLVVTDARTTPPTARAYVLRTASPELVYVPA